MDNNSEQSSWIFSAILSLRCKSDSTLQENVTLITEINELRKELQSLRSQLKEYKMQLATLRRSIKLCPTSVDGAAKKPKDWAQVREQPTSCSDTN